MEYQLNLENAVAYLIDHAIVPASIGTPTTIAQKEGKNFNVCLQFPSDAYLIKQELSFREEQITDEFWQEWRMVELVQKFPELGVLQSQWVSPIHFNADLGILVVPFLSQAEDLIDFYQRGDRFPLSVAIALGTTLSKIHTLTAQNSDCANFFADRADEPSWLEELDDPTPEWIASLTPDGQAFVQRYSQVPGLSGAIAQLLEDWTATCLIHADLRFPNVLVMPQTIESDNSNLTLPELRLIDWEKLKWGDPLYDVGTAIAGYVKLWLDSLDVQPGRTIDQAMRTATIPLERVQPSLKALVSAYFGEFKANSPALIRSIQYAGIVLLDWTLIRILYDESFDVIVQCRFQVGTMLVLHPQRAIATLFGVTLTEH